MCDAAQVAPTLRSGGHSHRPWPRLWWRLLEAKAMTEGDRRAIRAVEQTRSALRQILDWLASLPFDAEDLADIAVAVPARRRE